MNQHFSLILLLSDDPGFQQIEELRQAIIAQFGGGSAVQLPPHITLVRWQGTSLTASCVIKALGVEREALPVDLGKIEMAPTGSSIWYHVSPSLPLRALVQDLQQTVESCGGHLDHAARTLHLTLAYKDYDEDEVRQIMLFVDAEHRHVLGVKGSELALCVRRAAGQWGIYDVLGAPE
jgi:2'-5' RNA ligase